MVLAGALPPHPQWAPFKQCLLNLAGALPTHPQWLPFEQCLLTLSVALFVVTIKFCYKYVKYKNVKFPLELT